MSRRGKRSRGKPVTRVVAPRPSPRRAAEPARNHDSLRVSPREFLRERRPHYFSDSTAVARPRLDRAFLEYYISKLTSRSQEIDFESFARQLCEREVCPNLLPHTGPTGGGDSKVDSETYPVSYDVADTWYVGEARLAASERWAFAFSAKADWRSKLRSDIEKMAGTERGYARYYFVTSQYVPDRTRAELEDEYRNQKAIEVHIFDLNWLLEKVFGNGHEQLAVETLHIETELAPESRRGPNDAERAAIEAEVEEKIKAALESGQIGPRTVGLALESAILSRESERPRAEVDGKFERAARLAGDHGLKAQQRSVAYQRAWTAYWWLEDGPAFAELVLAYEAAVHGSENAFELERLANLYMCARVGVADRWQARDEWQAERWNVLNGELERVAGMASAPSAALNARVTQLIVRLSSSPDEFEETLHLLNEALDSATGLAGFGFEALADLISELGSVAPQLAAFDALHDRLVELVRQRTGDIAAGEMYVERAAQLYSAQRRSEAITAAGRALPLLYAEESRSQLLRALDLIGECYLAMGLPWAARGSWLIASSLAGSDAQGFGRGFPRLAMVLDRLRSVELRVGRLVESLAIHRLYRIVASVVAREYDSIRGDIVEADVAYEFVLTNAFLNLDGPRATSFNKLPDLLEAEDLPMARAALLRVLGHESTLPDWVGVEPGGELRFLSAVRAASGGVRLDPDAAGRPGSGTIETRVLGVRVQVAFEGGSPAKETAESILAAMESVLATSAGRGFAGYTPLLVVHVRPGHFTPFPWRLIDGNDGDPIEVVVALFDPSHLTFEQQGAIREGLVALVARIIPRAFIVDDPDETFRQLFGEEGALARAANFTGSFVTAGDLYDASALGLDGLLIGKETEYPPTGIQPRWDDVVAGRPQPRGTPGEASVSGPPDLRSLRHDEMRVESVINIPVWDRAQWRGMGFFMDPSGLPGIALLFRNPAAASMIWKEWQRIFGTADASDRLRLSIVTQVRPDDPYAYKAVVAPAPEAAFDGTAKVVFMTARVLEMNPSSDTNLRNFRAEYELSHGCLLGFALMPRAGADFAQPEILGTVHLSRVRFVEAKDVSDHDMESVALLPDH
jgi:hypothetical protein